MIDTFQKRAAQMSALKGLRTEENAVLGFLQQRLAREQRNQRSTILEKLEASVRHRKRS